MSRVPTMAGSQYKTPTKFTSSRKNGFGLASSGLGFSSGFDQSNFKTAIEIN